MSRSFLISEKFYQIIFNFEIILYNISGDLKLKQF
jgi:hypothetical protein